MIKAKSYLPYRDFMIFIKYQGFLDQNLDLDLGGFVTISHIIYSTSQKKKKKRAGLQKKKASVLLTVKYDGESLMLCICFSTTVPESLVNIEIIMNLTKY